MSSERYLKEIQKYVSDYKIEELFNYLSEMVFFFKPEDPKQFLIDVLSDLDTFKEKNASLPILYTEDSLKAYFRLLDPVGKGVISWDQMRSALGVLGAKNIAALRILERGTVDQRVFVSLAKKYLQQRIMPDKK